MSKFLQDKFSKGMGLKKKVTSKIGQEILEENETFSQYDSLDTGSYDVKTVENSDFNGKNAQSPNGIVPKVKKGAELTNKLIKTANMVKKSTVKSYQRPNLEPLFSNVFKPPRYSKMDEQR